MVHQYGSILFWWYNNIALFQGFINVFFSFLSSKNKKKDVNEPLIILIAGFEFVHLQKFKNPRFSRAVLPFFSWAFPGLLEVQNENNVHNELFKTTFRARSIDSILE